MKTDHFKLSLSEGRAEDATEAVRDEIVKRATESMESIKDPELLLEMRQTLRLEISRAEDRLKKMKTSNTKTNKKRDVALKNWKEFSIAMSKLIQKHELDFREIPIQLSYGATFSEKLLNINPDSWVQFQGVGIPPKRSDGLLDDDRTTLFESMVKSEVLEQIIQRKSKVMKELFSADAE